MYPKKECGMCEPDFSKKSQPAFVPPVMWLPSCTATKTKSKPSILFPCSTYTEQTLCNIECYRLTQHEKQYEFKG